MYIYTIVKIFNELKLLEIPLDELVQKGLVAPPENTSSPSVDAESDSEEYNSDLEKYDQEGRGHARQNARYMQTKVTIQTHTWARYKHTLGTIQTHKGKTWTKRQTLNYGISPIYPDTQMVEGYDPCIPDSTK